MSYPLSRTDRSPYSGTYDLFQLDETMDPKEKKLVETLESMDPSDSLRLHHRIAARSATEFASIKGKCSELEEENEICKKEIFSVQDKMDDMQYQKEKEAYDKMKEYQSSSLKDGICLLAGGTVASMISPSLAYAGMPAALYGLGKVLADATIVNSEPPMDKYDREVYARHQEELASRSPWEIERDKAYDRINRSSTYEMGEPSQAEIEATYEYEQQMKDKELEYWIQQNRARLTTVDGKLPPEKSNCLIS